MNLLKSLGRLIVTLAFAAAAAFVGWQLWIYYMEDPWTRDGKIRADVVNIAADVSGLAKDVLVKDNQTVKKGDILFRVDQTRFIYALAEDEAAAEEAKSAWDEAIRERDRQLHLGDSGSAQTRDQAISAEAEAAATYKKAVAVRDLAKLDLERTEVRSTVNGKVTNLDLQPGDYVSAGSAKLAIVDQDSLRAEGYFEENKLVRIKQGDQAIIRLMGHKQPLRGHVDSIAGGIEDRERTATSDLLANITPTFNWVRLAQRVPVRVHLDQVPEGIRLVSGLSATVEIIENSAKP